MDNNLKNIDDSDVPIIQLKDFKVTKTKRPIDLSSLSDRSAVASHYLMKIDKLLVENLETKVARNPFMPKL